MKAFSVPQSSLFFKSASADPLISPWSAPFLTQARCSEAANKRAARRQLRQADEGAESWHEPIACLVLGIVTVSAYATMIWQFGQF